MKFDCLPNLTIQVKSFIFGPTNFLVNNKATQYASNFIVAILIFAKLKKILFFRTFCKGFSHCGPRSIKRSVVDERSSSPRPFQSRTVRCHDRQNAAH